MNYSVRSFIRSTGHSILAEPPKKIVLSGPSGFLGRHVLDSILLAHELKLKNNENPGELILLSYSPGNLMERLHKQYGSEKMKTVRASRVDYYTQHDVETWINHLGSLGLEGNNCVFINLAAITHTEQASSDRSKGGLGAVNYQAPLSAAKACKILGFGHWIQASTQAVIAERAGQVPYSRGKAMLDFALSRMDGLPVSVACLGLLYCKNNIKVGQDGPTKLSMTDLSLLPLTPIMGCGTAALQPQEVSDAAYRLAYLALTNASKRNPLQPNINYIKYDAVGPETITILELLRRFAIYQGKKSFRPVHIGYSNMEAILSIRSIGNLNRQFVSLLRSEQESNRSIIGDRTAWEALIDTKLLTLEEAFHPLSDTQAQGQARQVYFPYLAAARFVLQNPRIILPGLRLSAEITGSFLRGGRPA